MGKVVFILFLAAVIYLAFASRKRVHDKNRARHATEVAMVACAHCGVHAPIAECIAVGTSYYCCEEHRRLGSN